MVLDGITQQDPVPGSALVTSLATVSRSCSWMEGFLCPGFPLCWEGLATDAAWSWVVEVCSYCGGSGSRELGQEAGQNHFRPASSSPHFWPGLMPQRVHNLPNGDQAFTQRHHREILEPRYSSCQGARLSPGSTASCHVLADQDIGLLCPDMGSHV